ncbi:hypothetical protein ACHHYP_07371 [Achlya hypogyna]|uniref:Uncharacterized protein n=1 Tax=Achlya hypogyna TaxID=1202772 RepID=A0A1V9ZM71_ACHHY|nr:hypothetical protein ACHHYP_07371 [Achlya hypogyna]
MARIYLHCKPRPGDAVLREWTHVLKGVMTAHEALAALVAAHNTKFGTKLRPTDLLMTHGGSVVRANKKLSLLLADDACEIDVTREMPKLPPLSPKPILALAAKHKQRNEWRSAKALWTTVLKDVDPANVEAGLGLLELYMQASAWAAAKAHATTFLGTVPPAATPAYIELCLRCAQVEMQLREWPAAVARLQQLQTFVGASSLSSETEVAARVEVALARAHHARGATDTAISLVRQRLVASDETDLDAIALYSEIAMARGRPVEAMQMILKVLTGRSKDKAVQAQFAAYLAAPDGFAHLKATLDPTSASTAPAFAFLATLAKDHGAIDGCLACFETAVALAPANASYALNYVHALEVVATYNRAYAAAVAFLRMNPALRIGGLSVAAVAAALAPFPSLEAARGAHVERLTWSPRGFVQVDGAADECDLPKERLPEADWDLLALLFALVKVLFIEGCFRPLPGLLCLVEPVRARVGHHLHETTIRNEHAYYCCIAQLLCVTEPPLVPPPVLASEAIYVCGDSHTLPTAWRALPSQSLRFVPALVTGLKHWHLRPESAFYPKHNFHNVVRRLPPRARVLFLLGEIDCREGILVAVEKCRYESLDEGMTATIGIFMKVLEALVAEHRFQALIHPVVPVLNETRHLVMRYNALFRAQVDKASFCTWIDCFDNLLDARGQLRLEYALDGTHLHPAYIAQGLSAALARQLS